MNKNKMMRFHFSKSQQNRSRRDLSGRNLSHCFLGREFRTGRPSSLRLARVGVVYCAIVAAQNMGLPATAMETCSPPTKGVAKVNKDFTLPREMSWNIDTNAPFILNTLDKELSDWNPTYSASNQGGYPGSTNVILEIYQFYFPMAGTALSEKDKETLATALSNPS